MLSLNLHLPEEIWLLIASVIRKEAASAAFQAGRSELFLEPAQAEKYRTLARRLDGLAGAIVAEVAASRLPPTT